MNLPDGLRSLRSENVAAFAAASSSQLSVSSRRHGQGLIFHGAMAPAQRTTWRYPTASLLRSDGRDGPIHAREAYNIDAMQDEPDAAIGEDYVQLDSRPFCARWSVFTLSRSVLRFTREDVASLHHLRTPSDQWFVAPFEEGGANWSQAAVRDIVRPVRCFLLRDLVLEQRVGRQRRRRIGPQRIDRILWLSAPGGSAWAWVAGWPGKSRFACRALRRILKTTCSWRRKRSPISTGSAVSRLR